MLTDPLRPRQPLTPEQELEAAKRYTTSVIKEIEDALIGEIEKMEGKVPTPDELQKHGTCRIDPKTGVNTYFWRGLLLVTATPGAEQKGVRGTKIEVHRQFNAGPGRKVGR